MCVFLVILPVVAKLPTLVQVNGEKVVLRSFGECSILYEIRTVHACDFVQQVSDAVHSSMFIDIRTGSMCGSEQ